MNDTFTKIGIAIIGVAVIALIVTKNNRTVEVIDSIGATLSGVLQAAIAPITGA